MRRERALKVDASSLPKQRKPIPQYSCLMRFPPYRCTRVRCLAALQSM
jgi:hypothetical protein